MSSYKESSPDSHTDHFQKNADSLFISLVVFSFIALFLYRFLITAPIWFDEVLFKAIIFGAPLWIFALKIRRGASFFHFERKHFWVGAFNGLAIGGIFGFLGLFSGAIEKGSVFIPYLFSSSKFWGTFGLAFATAWWESLFFYGLVLSYLAYKYKNEWISTILATLVFLLFHAPVLILRSGFSGSLQPLLLLTFFAFGQAILFLRTKSVSSVIVSHAFWGMVLLVYGN